jgi:hypothetical protein
MRLMILISLLAASPAVLAEESIPELIAKLGDDEFATREAATQKITKDIGTLWPSLENALRTSSDAETRLRIRRTMAQSTRELVDRLMEADSAELERLKLEMGATNGENEEEIGEQQKIGDRHEFKITPDALEDLKKYFSEEQVAMYVSDHSIARDKARTRRDELRRSVASKRLAIQLKLDDCQTRIDQMTFAVEHELAIGPHVPKDWDPTVFSFAHRKILPVTFEFEEMPAATAFSIVARRCGLKIEFSGDTTEQLLSEQQVSLRIYDMGAEYAMNWISRLVGLRTTIDDRRGVVVIDDKPED